MKNERTIGEWIDQLTEVTREDRGIIETARGCILSRFTRAGITGSAASLTDRQTIVLLAVLKAAHIGDPK